MKTLDEIASEHDFVLVDNSIFLNSLINLNVNVTPETMENSLNALRNFRGTLRGHDNLVMIKEVDKEISRHLDIIKKSLRFSKKISRRYGKNPSYDRDGISFSSSRVSIYQKEVFDLLKSLRNSLRRKGRGNLKGFKEGLSDKIYELVEVVSEYVGRYHPKRDIRKRDSVTDEKLIATSFLYPLSRKGESALVTGDKGISFNYRLLQYVMSREQFFPENGYIFDALEDFPSSVFCRVDYKSDEDEQRFQREKIFDRFSIKNKWYFEKMREIVKKVEEYVTPRSFLTA